MLLMAKGRETHGKCINIHCTLAIDAYIAIILISNEYIYSPCCHQRDNTTRITKTYQLTRVRWKDATKYLHD